MSERRNPFPDPARLPPPYVNPHQTRIRPPTDYENLLGDAIEAAFAADAWSLEALLERLNRDGIRAPDGKEWTPERFQAVMAVLADPK